ncbi:MAG: hypothetical protein QME88_10265 [Actinomycetota bacterium]|nr:hypothetical protein [Actinomycetota bacterium]
MEKKIFAPAYPGLALALTLFLAAVAGGCSAGDTLKKVDLNSQLSRINKEVAALNTETAELVETIAELDIKEGQLSRSVELLLVMKGKTEEQLATTSELSAILEEERSKVGTVLSLAQQVLEVELGLKGDTAMQKDMAAKTLELVRCLLNNLGNFRDINNAINSKMDGALEIMRNM